MHQILASETSVLDDSRFVLDCGVEKYVVKATTPTEEHHQTSDWEETLSVLPGSVSRDVSLEVLRRIPGVIREKSGEMTRFTNGEDLLTFPHLQ